MKQLSLRLPPKGMIIAKWVTEEQLEAMVDKSGCYSFSGKIQEHPKHSFQYRMGRKIQPKDYTLIDKLPL